MSATHTSSPVIKLAFSWASIWCKHCLSKTFSASWKQNQEITSLFLNRKILMYNLRSYMHVCLYIYFFSFYLLFVSRNSFKFLCHTGGNLHVHLLWRIFLGNMLKLEFRVSFWCWFPPSRSTLSNLDSTDWYVQQFGNKRLLGLGSMSSY